MVTWNPGEILSARPTDSAPECGAPITKTGRVTLRALTMRMWRGGINRVIGAGLRRQWGRAGGESSGRAGAPSGAVVRSVSQYRTLCGDHISYVRATTTACREQACFDPARRALPGRRRLLRRRDRLRAVQQ